MTGTVTRLLRDFRGGDEEAATDLLRHFLPKMRKHVCSRARRLRIHDEDDIAMNAFFKFCDAVKNSHFQDVSDRTELWRVLCVIAIREANDLKKFEGAQFRGGNAETVSISDLQMPITSLEQRPDLQFELVEQCENFLLALDDLKLKRIATMKLHGYTNQEIANELAVSKRTVNYLVSNLKDKMLEILKRRAA